MAVQVGNPRWNEFSRLAARARLDGLFLPDAGAADIPLGLVRPGKEEPAGSVANALRIMAENERGAGGRRLPVDLVSNPDGTYTVADGNATSIALARMGLGFVRARVVGKNTGTPLGAGKSEYSLAQLASIADARDVFEGMVAGGARGGARLGRMGRDAIDRIRHAEAAAAVMMATSLYKAAIGEPPDWEKDPDGYIGECLVAMLLGQFSRVFYLGALMETGARALVKREYPRGGELIPLEGTLGITAGAFITAHDILNWDDERLKKDLVRMLKSVAPTRLPAKLWENYFGGGEEKKDK